MGSCAGKQSVLHKTKHANNNKSWASETKCCAEESPEIEEVKKREEKVYVSYFMDGVGLDDPIGVIVRLEEACIKLKSKIQAQKQLQSQQSTLTSISSANHLNSTRNSLHNNSAGVAAQNAANQLNTTQPHSDFQHQSIENKMQCYSTIIKLADFVQEKSQRLWENPFDDQVHDAIDSLFWAAKMLQLPCLFHFKEKVTEEIKKILPQEQYHALYKLSHETTTTTTTTAKQGNNKQSHQMIDQIDEEEYIAVSQRTE